MGVHRLWRMGRAAGVLLVIGGGAAERAGAQTSSGKASIPLGVRGPGIIVFEGTAGHEHSPRGCSLVRIGDALPGSYARAAKVGIPDARKREIARASPAKLLKRAAARREGERGREDVPAARAPALRENVR